MTTAADRLAALDSLDAGVLCAQADETLVALADIMNRETVLLRAGHFAEAGALTAQKTQLAQDYVTLSRAVQRQAERLRAEAPESLARLRAGHERLAAQMAENLRVLATARSVSEDLLTDVARAVQRAEQPKTYGAAGTMSARPTEPVRGLSINRAL